MTADKTAPTLPALSPEMYARLKADIARRGPRVPIFVDASGHIIDGRIRDQICKELGIKPKKIVLRKLTQAERDDWRLALNLLRRHLTREQVREMIAWEIAKDPEASDGVIADRVKCDPTTVGRNRKKTGAAMQASVRGADGRTYKRPTIVYTATERKAQEVARRLAELGDAAPDGETTIRRLNAAVHDRDRANLLATLTPDPVKDIQVLHGDFRTANIKTASMDLVFCDLPWAKTELAKAAAEAIFRVLKDNSYCCLYCGVQNMFAWIDAFRAAGLVPAWEIIIHYTQFQRPLYDGVIMPCHTPVLVFRKNPKLRLWTNRKPFRDVIPCGAPEKDYHHWQQVLAPAVELVHSFSRPGELICDLGVGSGTFAVATLKAGEGRKFVGWEIDKKTAEVARGRINKEFGAMKKRKSGFTG